MGDLLPFKKPPNPRFSRKQTTEGNLLTYTIQPDIGVVHLSINGHEFAMDAADAFCLATQLSIARLNALFLKDEYEQDI